MENQLIKVTETKALEDLVQRSMDKPVVIFKHSLTCPISASAYSQMQRYQGDVALVEVQRSRALSDEIAQRLGVRHESPQIIVLRNGQVLWDASHFKITADAVTDAVSKAGSVKPEAAGGGANE